MERVFEYAACCEKMFENYLNEVGSYRRKTTFYSDLSIAEFIGGVSAIKDTYQRVIKEWIDNIEYITEICMSLNLKQFEWDAKYRKMIEISDSERAQHSAKIMNCYIELFMECDKAIIEHYADREKELDYYYQTTD